MQHQYAMNAKHTVCNHHATRALMQWRIISALSDVAARMRVAYQTPIILEYLRLEISKCWLLLCECTWPKCICTLAFVPLLHSCTCARIVCVCEFASTALARIHLRGLDPPPPPATEHRFRTFHNKYELQAMVRV